MNKKHIASFIKANRMHQGISIRELAKQLFVSKTTIERLEKGDTTISESIIRNALSIFNTTYEELELYEDKASRYLNSFLEIVSNQTEDYTPFMTTLHNELIVNNTLFGINKMMLMDTLYRIYLGSPEEDEQNHLSLYLDVFDDYELSVYYLFKMFFCGFTSMDESSKYFDLCISKQHDGLVFALANFIMGRHYVFTDHPILAYDKFHVARNEYAAINMSGGISSADFELAKLYLRFNEPTVAASKMLSLLDKIEPTQLDMAVSLILKVYIHNNDYASFKKLYDTLNYENNFHLLNTTTQSYFDWDKREETLASISQSIIFIHVDAKDKYSNIEF